MKILIFLLFGIICINPAICQVSYKQPLAIGDHYEGGIIFSIEPSGQHGVIAAPDDLPEKTSWGENGLTNAIFMDEGDLNTKKIVTFIMKMKRWNYCIPAACLCDSLILDGHSDWYLPSINELKEMYDHQKLIGRFVAGVYCSSTEKDDSNSWGVNFQPRNRKLILKTWKTNKEYFVRCIRKF